jgi:hypothetical protein
METVLAAKELVRNEIRKWCACVRQGEVVIPCNLQRFPVGCDKGAFANAGIPVERPVDSGRQLFRGCSQKILSLFHLSISLN